MKLINMKEENEALAEAFNRMQGDDVELICIYAADFRKIIVEFELIQGRVPTADDLLWIESEHQGRDITMTA